MKNVNWSKLAAMSEVIGTIAIVASLAFVVQSVNQNTVAIQNTNLNHVYNRIDSLNSDIAGDPQLSVIYANKVFELENIAAEDAQFMITMRRELNQWEQYFKWYRDGLLDDVIWADWDGYYKTLFTSAFPEDWWKAMRKTYYEPFALHVDQIYDY
jgi:hypothetical protein